MTRHLLNLLTALSLLLFSSVTVLWVWSHFVREEFEWVRTNMPGTGPASALPQFPLFEHVSTMTWATGGVRLDAETLDVAGPVFASSGFWPAPGFTRRSSDLVGRYPTLRPEWQTSPPALRAAVSWGGFEFATSQGSPAAGWTKRRWSLTLPFWSLALLTGAWPLWRLVIRRRRKSAGFPVRTPEHTLSAANDRRDDLPSCAPATRPCESIRPG